MMYHAEWFNARVPAEMREFLKNELLPYWRTVGKFNVRVFETEENLGPMQFLLVTEMERIGDIDGWPARAQGDEKGKALMKRFREMRATYPSACVVKNIEG